MLNFTTKSFSVQVSDLERTVLDCHYTATVLNSSGVDHVDGNTVYRVLSVTKAFTELAVLLEAASSLDMPIGSYVPELNRADWEGVTLRLLGSQLAGVPRDGEQVPNYASELTEFPKDRRLIRSSLPKS